VIAVIDYGMGNLRSVHKAIERVGLEARLTSDPAVVARADRIVLPGVGAFGDAAAHLREAGLDVALGRALAAGRPFLGICLGLQLLFTESEEGGAHQGLDVIPGRVTRLPPLEKVPHMGWNQVEYRQEHPLFAGIPDRSYFYFVHSYYVVPDDAAVQAAVTEYGIRFTCAVARDNLFATQFHPEKSSTLGLRMLDNFGRWKP
jgi:glutamine amidotransferase